MVRVYKRKSTRRSTYSTESLNRALEEIRRGVITQYVAHKKYKIPQMTLSYHRRKLRGHKSSTMGRSTAIPPKEEAILAECLKTMEKWGWGLTRRDVFNIVERYVKNNNLKTPFKGGRPGEDWFLGFSRRHNLSIKKPQSVEYARKKCLDPFIINNYFEILKNQLDDLNLHDKPRQIWNLDETNFCMDPSKTKIVGRRGAPSSRTTAGSGRDNTTVLMAASADGFKAPPLIVYKAKNMWDDWVALPSESFPGTTYATTANGWMESNIFLRYFEKSLLQVFGDVRPILLIYDGHSSHVDDRLIRIARDNGVTILKLPPHSSHILQPLDLTVFKSLKVKWDLALVDWQRHNEGRKIPKKKFSALVGQIWNEINPEIISNGFKKAGIFPYNSEVVSKEQYDPLSYKRWKEYQQGNDASQLPNEDQQPGSSRVNQELAEPNCSFETLLLSTVKQAGVPEKARKRKVASGAEVITSDEVLQRIKDKNDQVKLTLSRRNKNKELDKISNQPDQDGNISEEEGENVVEVIYEDTDDDIEEEMREEEALNTCMEAISKPSEDIDVDDWVLVCLAGKKSKKYYVGQVVTANKDEDELEVKFTRKVPTLDPLSSSTFSFKDPEECAIIARDDVIRTLPKPSLTGRRGLLRFDVNFTTYNVQ